MNTLFDNRPKVKLNTLPSNPEKTQEGAVVGLGRFPSWLHRKLPQGNALLTVQAILKEEHLPTVCEEARCPNIFECWSAKTATFLALGKACTRSCGFCDIDFSKLPAALDPEEPERIARSVEKMGLKHVVITMVARDDLPDGGAGQLLKIVAAVRARAPEATIELLTSDFQGDLSVVDQILAAKPTIFNHNIETVRELTPQVRHKATYERTLSVLERARNFPGNHLVKSGIMVGLGETEAQVQATLRDLKAAGVDIVTIGQYLQANRKNLRVKAFITPEQFKAYEDYGHSIGIKQCYCGPFVRSSYNADLVLKEHGRTT